jgi:methylphosphotriester-DNA--protein-cysteine methyltransferase
MKIYLKNIVCPELERLGVNYKIDELGIEITSTVSDVQMEELDRTLQPCNLILTAENNGVTVKKIKAALKDLLYYSGEEMKTMLPKHIMQTALSYSYLDNVFHFETGISIEEYFNKKKIEYAKKLLSYYNLSLTEVSYQLGFDSTESFSEQFRSISGITPNQFKHLKQAVMEEA